MKKFFTILGVIFLFIFLVIGGLFYFCFNTTTGFTLLVHTIIPAKRLPAFSVEKVRTIPFRWMELSNLRAAVLIDGVKTEIKASGLGLQMHPTNPFHPPIFWVENLNVKTRDFSITNAEIKLGFEPGEAVPAGFGLVNIAAVKYQTKYKLRDIQGVIASLDPLILRPVEGEFLDGIFKAEITYQPKIAALAAKGFLADANMAQFAVIAGDQFKNSTGRFQSEFGLETEHENVRTLWIKAESPLPGGEMNADLFRIFLDYLPSNADKERIDELIRSRHTVPFDNARFTLKNISEKSFQGQFNFVSRALNIQLNIDLDINFQDIEMMNSLAKFMEVLGRFQNENG
ncbi:MAG: hypothetical protein HZC17_07810 [Candidatus Omnitrophica bacterium]|nr:hypothetical protein [Candidatus Omnitrophota bacterium]